MDYERLKEVIAKQIKENGRREITGPVLQAVLMAMVDSLGEVYPQTYTDEEKAQARANIDALSDYDGEITKEKLSAEVQAILGDVANKQNITDATLATIAKTIVGAINEVYKGGLKDASIATSKIEDGAITDAKIASGAVTTPKIANDAVTTEKVNDGAITEPKLDTDLANVITSAVQPAELASAIATALASYVAKSDIVSITGSATDKVMSQKAVTDNLALKANSSDVYTKEQADVITNALADSLSRIFRDLGMYPELEPVPLNSEVTGKYINSDGKYVDASDWNIASIGAVSLGNTYLLNMVSSSNMVLGVALFVSRVYKRDKEGKIIGTTLTPLFSAKNTSIPASGYVLFEAMDDYDDVLICYKPALATQMLVARWGFKASHATQLRNLRLIVDNKTDFEGIYELLTAGYALNLVGKGNGEPQAFLSRKTGGGNITDGSAVIKEVDGVQPIVWNQIVKNGNFADGVTGWRFDGSSSVSNNEATVTATTSVTGAFCELSIIEGHKYLINSDVKVSELNSVRVYFGTSYISGLSIPITTANLYVKCGVIIKAVQQDRNILQINSKLSVGETITIKNVYCIDLTQMFGAGNEPSTYEEYLDRISHYHIKDAYAYNVGEVMNYRGTGIKTTNVDGTKTYIRDWSEVMKKYFPDGMTNLNGVKDFFDDKKAVRKFGVVDLGSLDYYKGGNVWISLIPDYKTNTPNAYVNAFTTKYTQTIAANEMSSVDCSNLKFYANAGGQVGGIGIRDDAYTTAESFKAAMAGVLLYYELSEPVEDIFEKPLNLTYTVINGGTETSLATENSTQFEGSIAYNKDYVAVVDELQMQNRVTQIEFENWEN